MPSKPNAPPPINPGQVAETQQGYNLKGGQQSLSLGTMNQSDPFGTKSYSSTIDPITGLPDYEQSKEYSPVMQALFDQFYGTKGDVGGGGADLWNDISSRMGQDPAFLGPEGTDALTNQFISNHMPLIERFMTPEREQLDTHLRNQGILPGTPAYQQQVDAQSNQQNLTKGKLLQDFVPQAHQMAKDQWALPAEMSMKLASYGAPGDLSFDSTPTANVGAADYQGAALAAQEQAFKNYQEKVKAQNAMMSGIFNTVGSVAKLPTSGGGSVGGNAITSMFGIG